jgi:MoaA/NifB/PqqE/SkfB family radical SAM enzyme
VGPGSARTVGAVGPRLIGRLAADARLLLRARNVRRGGGPFKLTAVITWRCDQRCRNCSIWQRDAGEELSAAEWRAVFASVPTLSWIDLTGGEPLAREDFAEIAVAALQEHPELALLHFPTSGSRPEATEAACRTILRAKPHRLIATVSLDGPKKENDWLRGDRGGFDRAVATFERLRRLGVATYFGMTLSPSNLHLVDATVAALAAAAPSFERRELHVNLVHESEQYYGNAGVVRLEGEQLGRAMRRIAGLRGMPRDGVGLLEALFLGRVKDYAAHGRSPVPCSALAASAFVHPDGVVHPCHLWDRPVGSVRDTGGDLSAVLAGSGDAREDVIADRCPGCWAPCEAYPSILSDLL